MASEYLTDAELTALLRDYAQDEGARLLEEEALWRGRVPPSIDRVAEEALADLERCVAAGTPFSAAERLSALPKPIPKAGGAAAARAAALVLAGTLAVGAV
ncbi:MAG: hypothetical protein IJ221_09465, partial [Oscillibacter sp.]|nr:hypothetical protein [Oscillibacter sp.]